MLQLLGKIAYFTVLGFVVIMLIGPVLGIAGAILPFALVGFAVWLAYRGVQRLVGRFRKEGKPIPIELRTPRIVTQVREQVREKVRDKLVRTGRLQRAGRVLQEMVCGALVAGIVVAAFSWQSPAMGESVAVASLAGAIIGFIVGRAIPDDTRAMRVECPGETC
jgi:hypothetical protein